MDKYFLKNICDSDKANITNSAKDSNRIAENFLAVLCFSVSRYTFVSRQNRSVQQRISLSFASRAELSAERLVVFHARERALAF